MKHKQEQHSLVAELQAAAIELGRTPTRDEFVKRKRGLKSQVEIHFGTYATLVQASGLDPVALSAKTSKMQSNAIFEQDIRKVRKNYVPRTVQKAIDFPNLAVISDIHWPFASGKVIDRFFRYVDDKKPDLVVINGDAFDMYAWSKFPRSQNIYSPKDEEQLSKEMNAEFWKEIKKLVPKARCVQTMGNHDVRPLRRTIEALPENEHITQWYFKQLFDFPGVEVLLDSRDHLELPGNIKIHHGWRSKLGEHRDFAMCNMIVGHTHLGGVSYRQINGTTLWELNSGFAGDPHSKILSYTPSKISNSTPGFGAVDEDGPRFILVQP